MSQRDQALLDEIAALLGEEIHREHPLHSALQRLYRHHLLQCDRLERLISIADGFQESARKDLHSTRFQLERQQRRQRKLSRIADRFQDLLHERNQALEDASSHDPLTGLANRRRLHHQLGRITEASAQDARPFCVAVVDIDHFKRINDRYGHTAGDRVLVALARALQAAVRTSDLCGRWGGEEFLVVLPDTDLDRGETLVERLSHQLRELDLTQDATGRTMAVTVSIGIAEHRSQEEYRETIHRADQALLEAKRRGRDRCCLASG
ncbi:biofilm regulation diguanylate cyclase SiaD [Halomonas sp. YLGW01]|uniref:biofilm regulation diguanylate cyclase SiaD n=1 Tax=Halomonas sp. YLGW01 TaxID=2773308 RepID=UPI00177DFF0E|nr:biofilm regulation diguanylate cyclase SiaD [Halomonas sp. YLGW01]